MRITRLRSVIRENKCLLAKCLCWPDAHMTVTMKTYCFPQNLQGYFYRHT